MATKTSDPKLKGNALETDGDQAAALRAALLAAGYQLAIVQDISDRRTDVLIGCGPVEKDGKQNYDAAFEAQKDAPVAADVLAKLGLTCREIAKSSPRFVLRDVRVNQPASKPADAKKA